MSGLFTAWILQDDGAGLRNARTQQALAQRVVDLLLRHADQSLDWSDVVGEDDPSLWSDAWDEAFELVFDRLPTHDANRIVGGLRRRWDENGAAGLARVARQMDVDALWCCWTLADTVVRSPTHLLLPAGSDPSAPAAG